MRFVLNLNLNGKLIEKKLIDTKAFDPVLDIKNQIEGDNYNLLWLRYHNAFPAITEYFDNIPFFENDDYLMVVSGKVFFRIGYEKDFRAVPNHAELLYILLTHREVHYTQIKGDYYILIFEKKNKNATIFSSPLVLAPAYFYYKDGMIIFSNHLDFIVKQIKCPGLNLKAMVEFSLFDHTLNSSTIIKNVYQIPGGNTVYFNCTSDTPKFKLGYDIVRWLHRDLTPRKEALQNINDILQTVLHNYINSTEIFNLSLTGGFDGRLNLAFVRKADYNKMSTFSYGMRGSNQISIPLNISSKLKFRYNPVYLDENFVRLYADLGYHSILLTGGVTGFNRANYPYAYGEISKISRNCILGQCDMIRPLYKNPAGSIFNVFSETAILTGDDQKFMQKYKELRNNAFIHPDYLTEAIAAEIIQDLYKLYVEPYSHLSAKEKFYFFLYKESLLKFWQTECHLVNLFVDDFIPFSDLDYVEELHRSPYCGLYKGILAKNQFRRRGAHDLYIELAARNNSKLNYFFNDRYFMPIWLNYGIFGFAAAGLSKKIAQTRKGLVGNDTFNECEWPQRFYGKFSDLIAAGNDSFVLKNLISRNTYEDNNQYRKERHISLKIWMDSNRL